MPSAASENQILQGHNATEAAKPRQRVLLCTNAGLCSSLALNSLISNPNIKVVGVFLSARTRTTKGSLLSDIARMIQTSGWHYFFYLALGTAIFNLLRLPGFLPTTIAIAKSKNLPLKSSKDINQKEIQQWITGLKPDVIFSCFFNQRLESSTLNLASQSLNLHPALLPAYKGVDPVFYYFLRREQNLGVSLHEMAEEFDTGVIIRQSTMSPVPNRSVFWHNLELFRLGLKLFDDWVTKPSSSENMLKNNAANQAYDSWPSTQEVRKLSAKLWRWKDLFEQAKRF